MAELMPYGQDEPMEAGVQWHESEGEAIATRHGGAVWAGTVDDGAKVITVLPMGGSDDAIVLLDCEHRPVGVEKWHPSPNVVRLGPDGEIRWRAELVQAETAWKCYLRVEWIGERLRALAPSYDCTIDANAGQLVEAVFTK